VIAGIAPEMMPQDAEHYVLRLALAEREMNFDTPALPASELSSLINVAPRMLS